MWLAPLGLDSNLEITALCTYAEEKKWTKTECNRLIHLKDSQSMIRKKGIACQSLEQLLLQWRCLAIDSRLHQAPRVPTVSLVHNCPCTTASLFFPCNYRYLLDLARLSDWISSLSNRPEVVSTLQGKKGKKRKDQRFKRWENFVCEMYKPNTFIRLLSKILFWSRRTVFCNSSFKLEKKIV